MWCHDAYCTACRERIALILCTAICTLALRIFIAKNTIASLRGRHGICGLVGLIKDEYLRGISANGLLLLSGEAGRVEAFA